MSSVEAMVPVLRVTDVARSMEWYATLLGCTVDPFPAVAPYEFCILRCAGVELMLRRADSVPRPTGRAYDWDVYIRLQGNALPDLATHAARYAAVVRGPELMPYGQVEFEVQDPDGYRLCLAEVLSDVRSYPVATA